MKLGLTTVQIAVAGIDSYKVTVIGNNLHDYANNGYLKTFLLDYQAGGVPLDIAVNDLLRMVVEELSR